MSQYVWCCQIYNQLHNQLQSYEFHICHNMFQFISQGFSPRVFTRCDAPRPAVGPAAGRGPGCLRGALSQEAAQSQGLAKPRKVVPHS